MDHKSGSYGGYWLPTHFQKMSKDEIKMKDTGVKGSSMLFMITDPKIQLWEALEAAKFSDMNHFVKILTEISSKNTKNKLDIHLDYLRSWVEQQRLTGSTLCAEFLSGKESFIKWADAVKLVGGPATALYSAFVEFLKGLVLMLLMLDRDRNPPC